MWNKQKKRKLTETRGVLERVYGTIGMVYLSVDTLVAVCGLYRQDDSGWGVLAQHQRVSKRLEDGTVVVDVLFSSTKKKKRRERETKKKTLL